MIGARKEDEVYKIAVRRKNTIYEVQDMRNGTDY